MKTARHDTWEYYVVLGLNASQLNELGADGWELVTVTAGELFYLKRPGPAFREELTVEATARYAHQSQPGEAENE